MKYDYICLGGGSAGIASANRAAEYGARVALIEARELGGTCVNVGCVPKKVMWYGAQIAEALHYAGDYGFPVDAQKAVASLDWAKLVRERQAYIARIHGSYEEVLAKNKVDIITGYAKFTGPRELTVKTSKGPRKLSAPHISIAVGGHPIIPALKGAEHGIDSNDFFALKKRPKRVALVGGGYIAVELAGVLQALGVEVHAFFRQARQLRSFDKFLGENLAELMEKSGIAMHRNSIPKELVKEADASLSLHLENGRIHNTDLLIWAIGRKANTSKLNLEAPGIKVDKDGFIPTDAYQNTTSPGIYAIGDVKQNNIDLTPVAIKAGRSLSERLFNAKAHLETPKMDYDMVPSVIFSHPPIGVIGLTEEEARAEYGAENIRIYKSSFTSMYSAITKNPEPCHMKLICVGSSEKVLGLHGIGYGIDEIIQGFSVAMKMGACKADFDRVVAIHPTASEEFVTMR